MGLPLILVAIASILIPWYWYTVHRKLRRLKQFAKAIPGPPVVPLFGNSLSISRNAKGTLHYFVESQKKYGTITRYWVGPTTLHVILSDPNDIEMLLRDTKNISKSVVYDFTKPWLGEGLITSTGEHWKKHRRILTPTFSFRILEKFVDIFNEKGKILIERLNKKVGQGDFDVLPYIKMYALDTIIETAMGITNNAQVEGDTAYTKSVNRMTEIIIHRFLSLLHNFEITYMLTQMCKEEKQALSIIHSFNTKIIAQKKKELENVVGNFEEKELDDTGIKKRLAFLDLLLLGQKEGSGLSDRDVQEEVNTFMFAGHDTTSAAISLALYHLANNPHIQQKAYDEIVTVQESENGDLTFKDLQNYKYIEQVTKESLRLTPTVPIISRKLDHDLPLRNCTLPAGSGAAAFIYMVHRNPEIFPDPEKFDPDRFSEQKCRGRHPFAFIPFSAGPRNCIGQKYAQLEVKLVLIKILMHYRLLPGKPIENLINAITIKSTNGIRIRLEKRKHS